MTEDQLPTSKHELVYRVLLRIKWRWVNQMRFWEISGGETGENVLEYIIGILFLATIL